MSSETSAIAPSSGSSVLALHRLDSQNKIAITKTRRCLLMTARRRSASIRRNALVSAGRGSLNPTSSASRSYSQPWCRANREAPPCGLIHRTTTRPMVSCLEGPGAEALLIKDGRARCDAPGEKRVERQSLQVLVKPRKDGQADVDVEAEFTGEDAVDLREDLVPGPPRRRARHTWRPGFRRSATAVLSSYTIGGHRGSGQANASER